MSAQYDAETWATETTLGRRVFNVNFRLTGTELRGWELVNSDTAQHAPGVTERVYIWKKKGAKRETLIRVEIVELDDWRIAQQHLQARLLDCMRPDIPRAGRALAATGDVAFAGRDDATNATAAVFFARGNVLVSVMSAGEAVVDVSPAARTLDAALREPPKDAELSSGVAEQRSPRSFEVEEGQPVAIVERLSQATASAWLKVIAPDGELRREGDRLVYVAERGGRKRVGQYSYTLRR
jgi:hypothetical protein